MQYLLDEAVKNIFTHIKSKVAETAFFNEFTERGKMFWCIAPSYFMTLKSKKGFGPIPWMQNRSSILSVIFFYIELEVEA